MVDRLVYWRKWDKDGAGWNALARFTDKLIDLTAHDVVPPGFPHNGGLRQSPRLPARNSCPDIIETTAKEVMGGKLVMSEGGILFIRAEDVTFGRDSKPALCRGMIAVSENARLRGAEFSVVVAGEDIKVNYLKKSILVCDGDVELLERPDAGLIIARGKVTCRNGKFTGSGCIIRSENFYESRIGKKIIIKEGTPDPLGFVKFFELADVGLVVADPDPRDQAGPAEVRFTEVRKGLPFASGLHAGDVVTALDGTKVTSKENFRRLLRRKLAQGGPNITFTVRRSEKRLDIPIPVKD